MELKAVLSQQHGKSRITNKILSQIKYDIKMKDVTAIEELIVQLLSLNMDNVSKLLLSFLSEHKEHWLIWLNVENLLRES